MPSTEVNYITNSLGQLVIDKRNPLREPAFVDSGKKSVVVEKSANFTLTPADSGKTFVITSADKVASLPATQSGLQYTFFVSTLSTTTGFSISPVAADQIIGGGITPADDKDLINTAATDAVGDLITLVGNGSTGWLIVAKTGTWARQA